MLKQSLKRSPFADVHPHPPSASESKRLGFAAVIRCRESGWAAQAPDIDWQPAMFPALEESIPSHYIMSQDSPFVLLFGERRGRDVGLTWAVYMAEHAGNSTGPAHGGAIAAVFDFALAMSSPIVTGRAEYRAVTKELAVQYRKPAGPLPKVLFFLLPLATYRYCCCFNCLSCFYCCCPRLECLHPACPPRACTPERLSGVRGSPPFVKRCFVWIHAQRRESTLTTRGEGLAWRQCCRMVTPV